MLNMNTNVSCYRKYERTLLGVYIKSSLKSTALQGGGALKNYGWKIQYSYTYTEEYNSLEIISVLFE